MASQKSFLLVILTISLCFACNILPRGNNKLFHSSIIWCQFPFTFNGLTFHGCTTAFDLQEKLWCSVNVSPDGQHVEGYWGYCDMDSCQDNITTFEKGISPHNKICKTVKKCLSNYGLVLIIETTFLAG